MRAIVITVVAGLMLHLCLLPGTRASTAFPNSEVLVPQETELTVVTTREISSKTAHEDDAINLKVAEDVKINGQVVISRDTLVKGIVTNVKKSRVFGRGGSLAISIETTTTIDGQTVKLRSAKRQEGDDKTGTTVALVVLFGPWGFLKKGKNAIIKPGTPIKVFTAEEKKVNGTEEKKAPVRV